MTRRDPRRTRSSGRAGAAWRLLAMVIPGLVMALGHGCNCGDDLVPESYAPYHFESQAVLSGRGDAMAADGQALFAIREGLVLTSDGNFFERDEVDPVGLPDGWVTRMAVIPDSPRVLLAYVWGQGLYRSIDDGAGWARAAVPPESELIASMLNERYQIMPLDFDHDPYDATRVLMAAPGGVFVSDDTGDSWTQLEISSTGKINLLMTGVALRGDTMVVVSQVPSGLVPDEYIDLIEGGVFRSTDGGVGWEDITGDLAAAALTGVDISPDGDIYVSAADGGLFRLAGAERWDPLYGPHDAVDVTAYEGGVSVASGSRGVWRLEGSDWSQLGDKAIVALTEQHALDADGQVYALEPELGDDVDDAASGTVHVALSFHVSCYHSYRGDTNDEDGFGQDIRVIRTVLDWLDEYPEVHADWDIDNAFSLDDVLPEYAPDIIERIDARLAADQDGLRLMSWNNGAVVSETREEFEASITWAQDSYVATFGGYDPGVQPQECMFTPDHIAWYRDLDVDWITLFYSATPFTGFRSAVNLDGSFLYNPLTLSDGDGNSMTLVPAYHHGDILDHGGLAAWTEQIADSVDGDTLLLIHMDADATVWENFALELDALAGSEHVVFTTIQDYLETHEPVGEITLDGDLADGTGDGFQSWGEKAFNHEIATGIARARETARWALAVGGTDPDVEALVDAALEPRLRALSTTHFGLAAPYLCDERMETARQRVLEAQQASDAALAEALSGAMPAPGTIEVINANPVSGRTLVEIPIQVPASPYSGTGGLAIFLGGVQQPAAVDVLDDSGDPVELLASVVLHLDAQASRTLSWQYDPADPATASGALDLGALTGAPWPDLPFTECLGVRSEATEVESGEVEIDDHDVRVSQRVVYDLPLCDGDGQVEWNLARYDELDGWVLKVRATMGTASVPEDAESVALSPLSCPGRATDLLWRTFGGTTRTREVRQGQEMWNGQSIDGWLAMRCEGGDKVQVSHRVTERTSLAFAPLRNDQGTAVIAPLGTLWGDCPWHDGRRTGGLGVGDLFTGLAGDQMEPAAPDWSGETVEYRLLLGATLTEGVMDLFAHPPLVLVGEYSAP